MSKLEDALRLAAEQQRGKRPKTAVRSRRLEDLSEDSGATISRPPVRFQLQAGMHHTLEPQVLHSHHIIHDAYSEDVLTRYKMLRTKVVQMFNTNEWSCLGVTAPHKGAGTTTTAINLAITLASQGAHDIGLLDLNLRDPSVADYIGLPNEMPGLGAYLDGKVHIGDILWEVGIKNLAVLANRDKLANSSERLTSTRSQEIISAFKHNTRNPLIICDLPPVLTVDDTVAVSPMMDAFLVVAAERETTREDLNSAIDALSASKIIGVVLNKNGRR